MKKDYLKPDTLNVVFTAGCLDGGGATTNPNSGDFNLAPARRGGGAGPAINY